MKDFRRRIIIMEIVAASRLGAFGDWWAASAARRLGRISGEPSKNTGEGA